MPARSSGYAGAARRRRLQTAWVIRFRVSTPLLLLYALGVAAVLAAVTVWPLAGEPLAVPATAPAGPAPPQREVASEPPSLWRAAWQGLARQVREAVLNTGTLKGALRAGLPGLAALDPPRLPLAEGEPLSRRMVAWLLRLTVGAEPGRPWTLLAAELPGGRWPEMPEPGAAVVREASLVPRWTPPEPAAPGSGAERASPGTSPERAASEGGKAAEPPPSPREAPALPSSPSATPEPAERPAGSGKGPARPPEVFVYHTHGSEAYLGDVPASTAAKADSLAFSADPHSSIIRVGKAMADRLQQHGIGVVHYQALFDRSEDGAVNRFFSYTWARQALTNLEGKGPLTRVYPTLRLVVDVHRDHVPGSVDSARAKTTAVIGGRPVARIMFVVGDDYPHARANYCLALALAELAERMYPGLSRGVRLAEGRRYNQDLAPASLLLEVGGTFNTLAEAERAAQLMADVIAEAYRRGMLPPPGKPFSCPPASAG